MKLLINAWEVLTTSGFLETLAYARHWISERLHERRYGIMTRKYVDLAPLGYDSQYVSHHPSPYRALKAVFEALSIRKDDVLIDFGSGAGRSALVAARSYPFKTIVGVELVQSLIDLAEHNLQKVEPDLICKDVSFVRADAKTFTLPSEATIAFLFNPFTGEILQRVLDNIGESLAAAPRRFTIAILNPVDFERPSWMKPLATFQTYPYLCTIYRAERACAPDDAKQKETYALV